MNDISGLQLGPLSPALPGPLYRQIVDAVKREVAAGRLPPGSALPSFRALAETLMVSLITVKRAYEELEREGVLYRRQGLGTFVAEHGRENSLAAARETARSFLADAVRTGREGGLSDDALVALLKDELKH